MTLPKPARLLIRYGRAEILKSFRADSCIASTAIGIKVLTRFGIEAWPVPVAMSAYNRIFLEMLQHTQGHPPSEEEQRAWGRRGAWVVEVDENHSDDGRFAGHLAIGVNGYLLDLSLDQATRPHKALYLEPLATPTPEGFYAGRDEHGHEAVAHAMCHDALVVYRYRPSMTKFEASPDWTRPERHEGPARTIEQRIRAQLRKR